MEETSAEENRSRDMDSSGEDREQGDITAEDLGSFPRGGMGVVEAEAHRLRPPFYSFSGASHQLMASSVLACRYPTAAEIVEADPSFAQAEAEGSSDMRLGRGEAAGMVGVEGRWRGFQDRLRARAGGCGEPRLFFEGNPDKLVAHTGQWHEIVRTTHVDAQSARHSGLSETLDGTGRSWIADTCGHGIPEAFVRACIAACPSCSPSTEGGAAPTTVPPFLEGRKRAKPPKFAFPVRLEVPVKLLPPKLEALAIEHRVVLRVLRGKRIATSPFLSEVVSYVCHRGQFKSLKLERREEGAATLERPKSRRASLRCGCNFRVKTLIPIANYCSETGSYDYQTEGGTALVLLNPVHLGHEPGSEADLVHLPVHPSAVRECEQDRHTMTDAHAIIRSSLKRSARLRAQASKLEQATFRFFLTKKETQLLPCYRKSRDEPWKDMTVDMHAKHNEAGAAMKVDSPQEWRSDLKNTLSTKLNGVGRSNLAAAAPARRLGFEKALARMTDGRQTAAHIDPISSVIGNREADASMYYARHKQGATGRHSARRIRGAQVRWSKDSEDSECPERCGRESARLDLVNKGISQLTRLQLSDRMELDADLVKKPLEEAAHMESHEQDGFKSRKLDKQTGDLSSDQRGGGGDRDLKCLGETWSYSEATDQIEALGTSSKRRSSGRQSKFQHVRMQAPNLAGEAARLGGTFRSGEMGRASVSLAQALGARPGARIKKNAGRKRKRNSVSVLTLSVDTSPESSSKFEVRGLLLQ